MSSDWLNVELDRLYVVERRAEDLAVQLNGRCGHGFVPGLCPVKGCASKADPAAKKHCRACGKSTRLDRERLCAECIRQRRRKGEMFAEMEAAE
jgi:hypothetical protein